MTDTAAPKNPCQHVEHRGCRLVYRVRGEGPPVLFNQGTSQCARQINALLEEHFSRVERG